jgi:hypothetical protein
MNRGSLGQLLGSTRYSDFCGLFPEGQFFTFSGPEALIFLLFGKYMRSYC